MRRCSEFGLVGKAASLISAAFLLGGAAVNIAGGEVRQPSAFLLALLGFVLFAVAKLSVILPKKRISFGTRMMTARMANAYRLGYWLMAVGVLVTFA